MTTRKGKKVIAIFSLIFILLAGGAFAYPLFGAGGQFLGNTIVTGNNNTFAIANTNDLQGGHMQFTSTTARNSIPGERRTTGMLATVVSTSTNSSVTYRLVSNRPGPVDNTGSGCATTVGAMVTDGSLDGISAHGGTCLILSDLNWVTVIPSLDASSVNQFFQIKIDGNGQYYVGIGTASASSSSATGTVGSVDTNDTGVASLFTISQTGDRTVNPNFTFSLSSVAANKVFAGPTSGGSATPTFRSLIGPDIASTSTATSGSILIGNGVNFNEVTLSGDATIATSGALTLKTIPGVFGSYSGVITSLDIDTNGRVVAIASTSTMSGGVTSTTSPDSTITMSITGGNTLNAQINLANPNSWTGLQGFAITNTATSGTVHGLEISPIYNQTSTSTTNNTDLFINRTVSAVGSSTTQLLIDAQVNGTSKFRVDASGNMITAGGITATGTLTLTGSAYSGANAGILYTNSSGVVSSLVTPSGTSCNILHGGTSTAPTYSCVDLSLEITGILGTANGGLGAAVSPTVGGLLFSSNGTSFTNLAIGSNGQILTASGGLPVWADNQGGWATLNGASSTAAWASIAALGGTGSTLSSTSTTLNQWLYSYFFPAVAPSISLSLTSPASATIEVGGTTEIVFSAAVTKHTNNVSTLAGSAGSGTLCGVSSFSATTTLPCGSPGTVVSSTQTYTGFTATTTNSTTNNASTVYTITVRDTSAMTTSGTLTVTYRPKIYILATSTDLLAVSTATATVAAAMMTVDGTTCATIPTTSCSGLTGTAVREVDIDLSSQYFYYAIPTSYSSSSNMGACYKTTTSCGASKNIKVNGNVDTGWGRRRAVTITNGSGFAQTYDVYGYKSNSGDDHTMEAPLTASEVFLFQ